MDRLENVYVDPSLPFYRAMQFLERINSYINKIVLQTYYNIKNEMEDCCHNNKSVKICHGE